MNRTMKGLASVVLRMAILIGFFFLPVIPMIQSPVTVMPIERHVLVSLAGLFTSQALVGVRHIGTAWTLPAIFAVIVAAFLCARGVDRRLFRN